MTEIVIQEQLSHRVAKGGFWVFALRITKQIFYIIRLIILARILAPADFGLLGIAMLTMMTLETFSQTGFQAALIQKKEDIDAYLNSAWTVGILRGSILFIILYFIAPYVAAFFNSPQAKPIIQVIGFAILINAFTNIGVVYFQKELEFNKQFIYQFSGTLAEFAVAVSAALLLRSVWALVFGLLAGNAARLVASYFIHPYKPHISFDIVKLKELFGFGKWVLGSSILIFLITQGDDIFVGKLLGATMLGFYQLAYKISNTPATEITHVISGVSFPAYSKLQDNAQKLRQAYLKFLQLTAFLLFPLAALIFALAPNFTRIFLGEKWMPMVPALQVLCIFGITRALNATIGSIFQGMGKPQIITYGAGLQLIMLTVLIYRMTNRWGILGTSIAVVIPNLFCLSYLVGMLIKNVGLKLRSFLIQIAPPFITSVILCVVLSFFHSWIKEGLACFSLSLSIGLSIYLILMCMFDRVFNWGFTKSIIGIVG